MSIEKTVDINIPSTPADRQKIKDAIGEMVDSLQRQSGETELRKDITDNLKEDFGMPSAVVNRMAKLAYADTFDSEIANNGAPDGAIAPLDSVAPALNSETSTYTFEFGFVPAGSHTLVYACNTGEDGDDPELYDDILLPNPTGELTTVTVVATETSTQNFPLTAP